jgi:plasmid maintenance system antidote protein VapI
MTNLELKGEIVKKHGAMWKFARIVDKPGPVISAVVNGRRKLPPEEKARWAELLGSDVDRLFPDESKA